MMRKRNFCGRFLSVISLVLVMITVIGVVVPARSGAAMAALRPYMHPANMTDLDTKLLAIMEQYNIVGLSAVVFCKDKILWSGGYGWANLETSRTNTPETVFRVASITKMVVGTALMQLYEQGKFHLDDDISKYLGYQVRNPHFPNAKITFRHLMTHTSSIIDGGYNRIVEQSPGSLRQINLKDMLVPGGRYFTADSFAPYAPGSRFEYSNFGTGIAGSLVEAISGMSLEKYCAAYIFAPLKMDASFDPANVAGWKKIGVLYRSYDQGSSYWPTKDNYADKPAPMQISAPPGNALGWGPAGSLRVNVLDLSKFMMAHMNGGSYEKARILKNSTADLMHGLQWFGSGMNGYYKQKGLNFHITDDLVPGQRLVGHSAEAYGLVGDAYFDPDTKFGLIFLFNGGNYTEAHPFYKVENQVAKVLYDGFAPRQIDKIRKIRGKANSTLLEANGRKIVLPVPAALRRTKEKANKETLFFVPEISAADALKAGIKQSRGDEITFTAGQTKAVLTVGKKEMLVNGCKVLLSQAPYKAGDHIMVPLRQVGAALLIKTDLRY